MSDNSGYYTPNRITTLGLIAWILAAVFFLYEFFSRTFISTIANDVMQNLHLTAFDLSLIGAVYYLAYSCMQIPVGMMMDKWGVKRLLILAVMTCAFGMYLFGASHSFTALLVSRFLMGFGSSFAFISMLLLALNWFPKKHFGFFSGATQILGAIGPLLAGVPLVLFLQAEQGDWRRVIFYMVYAGMLLVTLIIAFMQDRPEAAIQLEANKQPLSTLQNLRLLIKNPNVRWIAAYAFCNYASISVIGALWGTYFLETHGISQGNAASITSMIWIGLAIGSPLVGFISDRIQDRKTPLILCTVFGFFVTLIFILTSSTNVVTLSLLCFCLGLAGAGQTLSFACLSDHVEADQRATGMGLNNTAVMLGGTVITPIVGLIVNLSSRHTPALPGHMAYTQHDFTLGLAVMPVLFVLGTLIAVFKICSVKAKPLQDPAREQVANM